MTRKKNNTNNKSPQNQENSPLISIVVPIYNSEKYLSRCIESIIAQTYDNLEIILVDDASTDKTGEIIDKYAKQDSRIVKLKHKENQGLFQTRITGADTAHGKYLSFIDSDDYISIDWFRLLLKKAEETNSDIVVGEWCYDFDGASKNYLNLDPFRIRDYELTGDDILEAFMEQEGNCFSWWVVWNKLYRKDLWNRCKETFKTLSKEYGRINMGEDFAFSSGLWCKAQKVSNVHGGLYFYFKYNGAMTSTTGKNIPQYIRGISTAMSIMKSFLDSTEQYSRVENHYQNWRRWAASLLYHQIVLKSEDNLYEKQIREAFNETGEFIDYKDIFYSITTNLTSSFDWYENIKRQICSLEIKIVSFDVFETLIQRPFLKPSDLFNFLSYEYNKNRSSFVDFKTIRIEAETQCRKKIALTRPSIEEITLDEIYDEIAAETVIPPETLTRLKELEIHLELKFCQVRKTGKELYDLALESGKKIILCSDMYLPGEAVKEILKKNGYSGYQNLYLSSELKRTKSQKSLFNHIKKDLGLKNGQSILHIGDNWVSDVENSKACGWNSAHLPSSSDMFCGNNPGIYSGKSFSKIYLNNDREFDYRNMINDFPSFNALLGMAANKIFDNPYQSFHPDSDFNGSPVYVGYYVVGFYLLGIVRWLEKIARERKIPTIHFVARDGFLPKQAFDMYNHTGTRSNYLRISRIATLLFDVDTIEDLYSISKKSINIFRLTPCRLLELIEPIIPEERKIEAVQILKENKFVIDAFFHSEFEYNYCMKLICEKFVDISLLEKYKKSLRAYFAEMIKPGDYIFDVGYNGRPETALSKILGFPVNSFYIHVNSELAEIRQSKYNCKCECYYPYKPKNTGVLREHILMELGPSTIGYKQDGNTLSPIFEEYERDYYSEFITKSIQDYALSFVKDYLKIFGEFRDTMILPKQLLGAPFEFYLHYSSDVDRKMFSSILFEDKLWSGENLDIFDTWNNAIHQQGLTGGSQEIYLPVPPELHDIYIDGIFMKLFRKINRWFPKGGRAREVVKKIASIFIR